jgi:hypothetical protein
MAAHTMFDGRLQLYRRKEAGPWQAACRVGRQRFRQSTGEQGLERAKERAEEWYLDLRGKLRGGLLEPTKPKAKTFGKLRNFSSKRSGYWRSAPAAQSISN